MLVINTLGIITDGTTLLNTHLIENLKLVFGNYIEMNSYYFSNLTGEKKIEDDLILTMTDNRAILAKRYVKDTKDIIVINRTISRNEICNLLMIPDGTKVLVVNDTTETTLEMVSLLYRIGVNHLDLIPFDPSIEYEQINVAITPYELNNVPKNISKIIDIGHRKIDISTFIAIIDRLKIENKEISKKLIEYSEKVISLDVGIKSYYEELYTKREDLEMVINLSHDGIILTDNENRITLFNQSSIRIFETKKIKLGDRIYNLFNSKSTNILNKKNVKDEIIKYNEKYLNINKCEINHFQKKTGEYFNIQEVTHIKKLEQNLSRKLREKGHEAKYSFEDIITKSCNIIECINLSKQIAKSNLGVLITGETGTGKEIFAQSIHNESNRKNQPFVAINCAAMSESLLESELFGYEGGSFTGALKEGKIGVFEQANNGTLFLDEIGDMPIHLQTRLLRVLQEQQVMRIGADKLIEIDVRVIAATNQDLLKMIDNKKFRADLFYRINVLNINLPPLKERVPDIELLFKYFINTDKAIDNEAIDILKRYNWPGNIRELINVASYVKLMSKSNSIKVKDLPYYLNKKLQIGNTNSGVYKNNKYKGENSNQALDVEIMKIILNQNKTGKSVGRKRLLQMLLKKNILITESKIKAILVNLNSKGYIASKVGRGGSKITEDGLIYLSSNL